MKILVIAPGSPPYGGGVEVVVDRLSQRLVARGHEVEVWAADRTVTRSARRVSGGVTVRLFHCTRSIRYRLSVRLLWHAARHIRDFDVVNVHSYYVSTCLAALLSPRATPVVFTTHYHGRGAGLFVRFVDPLYRLAANRVLARSRRVVAVSQSERDLLRASFAVRPARCRVIANAADIDDLRLAVPFDDQPPTIVTVGRLEPYKRVDLVIRAFGLCTSPARLVVIGTGSAAGDLASLAAISPRVDDIELLGYVDRAVLVQWLRTARVFVSLSEREAFGISAYEAAAGGAQVLLSDIAAHREAAEALPDGAVTLAAGSVSDVARQLEALLPIENAGPRHVRDWDAVAADYAALFEDLVEG